jgi:5-methylcytosine-specific restriction endonuclease McrA
MGRRSLTTPRSFVRSALRRIWLRSRERAAALKREGYCCERCHAKQSRAKGREIYVEVHHKNKIVNWEAMIDSVFAWLLPDPSELEVLCETCHDEEHKKQELTRDAEGDLAQTEDKAAVVKEVQAASR